MSSEWPLVRLGDLISLKGGFAYKGDHLGSHGAVLLGMGVVSHSERFIKNGIRRYSGEIPSPHRVVAGDMVIATRQQSDNLPILGCPALVPTGLPSDEVVVGTNLYKVTNTSEVETQFLYWLLRGKEYQRRIVDCSKGTTVRMITKDAVEDFCFLCPPSEIRKEITDLLDAIDNRITLLRETNTALEAIAQAMFKSWFVDFDPVHAKMQGRAPECMDEATAALFPDSFEESALGAVPKGWKFSTLGESFELTMGQSPPGDTYNQFEDGLPFYQGRTDFGFRFPTKRIYCNAPTRLARIGDALVSVRAPVGDVNMAIERCCIGRGVAAVRHQSGCVGYTFYAMKNLGTHFKNFDTEGTIFGSINKKDFEALPVVVPSEGVLFAFDEISKALDGSIEINEQKIRAFVEIRDTLLPRLISGELSVTQASVESEA